GVLAPALHLEPTHAQRLPVSRPPLSGPSLGPGGRARGASGRAVAQARCPPHLSRALPGRHPLAQSPARPALAGKSRRQGAAATGLLVARAEEQLAVNRCVEARALARRALALDPFSEPALALGMRSAALEGDSIGALALYHEVAERLAREVGEKPSGALSALAARIRAGTWQRAGTRQSDLDRPLIGRREVH